MILKGKFVSIWENGTVSTNCTLNTETGELNSDTVDVSDLGCLLSETFEDSSGNEYPVCSECHTFITKVVVEDDQCGNGLSEVSVCSNPDCESRC